MNKTIKYLTEELDRTLSLQRDKVQKIREGLQAEYDKIFDDSEKLAKAISNAEQASEYAFDSDGGIQSWYRFADLSDYADCREYFETWLSATHGMYVDWKNDCLLSPQGGAFIINEDGDVYDTDSGKFFIDHKQYETEVELHKLIEDHMERTGYFPGVFRADHHGNVYYVNTKESSK